MGCFCAPQPGRSRHMLQSPRSAVAQIIPPLPSMEHSLKVKQGVEWDMKHATHRQKAAPLKYHAQTPNHHQYFIVMNNQKNGTAKSDSSKNRGNRTYRSFDKAVVLAGGGGGGLCLFTYQPPNLGKGNMTTTVRGTKKEKGYGCGVVLVVGMEYRAQAAKSGDCQVTS